MAYPRLSSRFSNEDLSENLTLQSGDFNVLKRIRRDENRLGFAVLLKTFEYLGYPPQQKRIIPAIVVNRISEQLGLDAKLFSKYKWKNRAWDQHISIIREYTGFRPFDVNDTHSLSNQLIKSANDLPSQKELLNAAIQGCRNSRIELPSEKELLRIINSARNTILQSIYQKIYERISPGIRERMDVCLKAGASNTTSYDWMKSKAGRLGMRNLIDEIRKLNFIKEFEIEPGILFNGISQGVLHYLRDRARPEDSYQMRRHPAPIRYSLMAVLLHFRQQDVTDNIVRSFLELIRRIEKKADKSLEVKLVKNIRRVYGKSNILYKIAKASTENPEGTIQDVIFTAVGEDVLKRIVDEFDAESQEADYDASKTKTMKVKYSHHYRKMLKPVLESLIFHANNPAQQPLMDGLKIVKKYADSRCTYYPDNENIPEELITGYWESLVYEETSNGARVKRYYFEICVLQKLEKAIKCKEVWVEGAYLYRNPDLDLPQDWDYRRIEYCTKLNIPQTAEGFIDPIRREMSDLLKETDSYFSRKRDVYIYYPGGGQKGLFRIPKIIAKPERPILQEIKNKVLSRWGIIDLLDVLIEADRQVDFSSFFYSTAQRQVLSRKEIKERLLLSLFGIATNLGLKRIYSATQPACSYDDLLYFRKRFVNIDSVRSAISALTNRILTLRNPEIWGCSTACASDGKYIGAWDQNLVAEWNPHYNKTGVMAYWHVDTNATCIYSHLKPPMSSQVAAMIKGLILHDTEMRIESNFVDSHGQSEVAFPFCRFIRVELSPRLKRMKYERLYLPDKEMDGLLVNLKGVLSRPIRWHKVDEQYGEMARHVVAVLEKTGPIESILRRFNSYNSTHPTYKAFIEAGKALKTIHVCKYLTRPAFRTEIHEGLNIVENWNSSNDFISYGRKSEIQTNDPEQQELAILCLHLLQNALILINTIMVERVLHEDNMLSRLQPEDRNSLTPLFTLNINPYGYFSLDFEKPSILEAA